MITSLYVDNFKSLVDFRLELARFNCLVGLNGADKPRCFRRWIFSLNWCGVM